ncbi:MAG: LysR family transcriptional regulator [Burkholderiaceae bacterium]|nr:LysR family transcriptional regulator [Burkholderiaceae bacterium]
MLLNLRQIEVFRAIMLTGSITKAAQLLHVSQPAISRLLSYTESRIGLKLFERIKGRLYPTPEAQRLFLEVEQVHHGVQRVNEVANDLIEKRQGSLHIAVSPSLGQTLIPMAVTRFRAVFPDVKVHVRTLISTDLVQALVTRQAEVGVAIVPLTHPSLHAEAIYENRLVAVLPISHPLADQEELDVSDLEGMALIGYGAETPYGQMVKQLFGNRPGLPRIAVEVRLTHIACAMVQAGAGIAIVDELAVSGRVWPDIVVRPIKPLTKMSLHMLHSNVTPVSLLAKDFMNILVTTPFRGTRTEF